MAQYAFERPRPKEKVAFGKCRGLDLALFVHSPPRPRASYMNASAIQSGLIALLQSEYSRVL